RIDTSLAAPLGNLPFPFAADMPSLAARNLVRGWRLSLPAGQALAERLGEKSLSEDELKLGGGKLRLSDISDAYLNNAPLWFYILAEAEQRGRGCEILCGWRRNIDGEDSGGYVGRDGLLFVPESPIWTTR